MPGYRYLLVPWSQASLLIMGFSLAPGGNRFYDSLVVHYLGTRDYGTCQPYGNCELCDYRLGRDTFLNVRPLSAASKRMSPGNGSSS